MSRCFPFPPPGYDKKAKNDESDLLAKEKHKEKRHKKDKKDKDRKEKKDKKDKGSKEKKDKKDKEKSKEKRKEKREKKDKHRDKDKNRERDRDREKDSGLDLKKSELQTGSSNRENPHPNKVVPVDPNLKHVQELGRRIRDVDCASRSHFPEDAATINERKTDLSGTINKPPLGSASPMLQKVGAADDRRIRVLGPDAELSTNRKLENKMKESKNGHQKENGQGADKPSGNLPSRMAPERMETFSKPLQNEDYTKQIDGKGKHDRREREGRGEKHKHTERKVEEKQMKSIGYEAKPNASTKDSLDFRNSAPSGSLIMDGVGKRKESESNGYLYDGEIRANKCAKAFTCHQPSVQSEDIKMNGFVLQPQHNVNSNANANGESCLIVKPPHPDSNYLNQILNVPRVEETPDFLDQQWLFSDDWQPRKKQNLGSPAPATAKQVWSEAMHIESADIIALPYVIPY